MQSLVSQDIDISALGKQVDESYDILRVRFGSGIGASNLDDDSPDGLSGDFIDIIFTKVSNASWQTTIPTWDFEIQKIQYNIVRLDMQYGPDGTIIHNIHVETLSCN